MFYKFSYGQQANWCRSHGTNTKTYLVKHEPVTLEECVEKVRKYSFHRVWLSYSQHYLNTLHSVLTMVWIFLNVVIKDVPYTLQFLEVHLCIRMCHGIGLDLSINHRAKMQWCVDFPQLCGRSLTCFPQIYTCFKQIQSGLNAPVHFTWVEGGHAWLDTKLRPWWSLVNNLRVCQGHGDVIGFQIRAEQKEALINHRITWHENKTKLLL